MNWIGREKVSFELGHSEERGIGLMIAFWVSLSFFAMLLPALACFSKLKRDKRHTYRHAPATIPNKYVLLSLSCPVPSSPWP